MKWMNDTLTLMLMPGPHHGLIWVISSSDLWAMWVRFWHVRRGYGSCCTLNSLFAYIRYEFGLLPLFLLQYLCPELSVSNYSKSAVLLILNPWWKKLFLKGFGADSFKSFFFCCCCWLFFFFSFVCVEPAVTGLLGTCWSLGAKSFCWAAPGAGTSELSLTWWRHKSAEKTNTRQGLRKIPKLLIFSWAGPDLMWHKLCVWLAQKWMSPFHTRRVGSSCAAFPDAGVCYLLKMQGTRAPCVLLTHSHCVVTHCKTQLVQGYAFLILLCNMFLCLRCNRQDFTTEPRLCVWATSVSPCQVTSSFVPVFIFIPWKWGTSNVSSEIIRKKIVISWSEYFCSACKPFFYFWEITNRLTVQLESIPWGSFASLELPLPAGHSDEEVNRN